MYKFYPHCGKPFVEPSEPRPLDLITRAHSPITWVQVGEWSDRHEASKHFEIGDEISDTLKTGEEVVFVVVGKDMYQPGGRDLWPEGLSQRYPLHEYRVDQRRRLDGQRYAEVP